MIVIKLKIIKYKEFSSVRLYINVFSFLRKMNIKVVSITCIVSKNTRCHISKKWYKTKQFPENQESENQEFVS